MRMPPILAGAVAAVSAAALTAALVPPPATASAPASAATDAAASADSRAAGELTSKVRGTYPEGVVRGTFTPDRFFNKKGEVYAEGTLRAVLKNDDGTQQKTSREIRIPVKAATASAARAECDILNLVLGPLDLNLLGLEVHLNRVVLDIVAVPGAGNLLGNLLCAVAGLLDGTDLNLLERLKLANLLNRILNLLG
ncbi:MAG: ABC transporter substrate-binding protein [Nocardioidaceae bacterium]|nr:ABC transporter substrate-binding protein [Nocardioidaceae bacterium]